MPSNSIINNLSSFTAISEISLLLYEPKNLNKTFIIVEGINDCKLMCSLLSKDTIIIESYGSKNDAIAITKHFNNKRVISVLDRDYDYNDYGKRVFYYDYTNLEMMIISNNRVFNRAMIYLGVENHNSYLCIREKVLDGIRFMGYLRRLNYEKNWSLSFNGLRMSKVYSENDLELYRNIITELKRLNPERIEIDNREDIIHEYVFETDHENTLLVANGHDFMSLFNYLFCNNISTKILLTIFISTFNLESFQDTQLYSKLKKYGEVKKLQIC